VALNSLTNATYVGPSPPVKPLQYVNVTLPAAGDAGVDAAGVDAAAADVLAGADAALADALDAVVAAEDDVAAGLAVLLLLHAASSRHTLAVVPILAITRLFTVFLRRRVGWLDPLTAGSCNRTKLESQARSAKSCWTSDRCPSR
jgi:hypothetical protein